jgi:hypothetical protein
MGARAAITALEERCFAVASAVLPSIQPPQLNPITIVATAPATTPHTNGLVSWGIFIVYSLSSKRKNFLLPYHN